jgi:hypothetical protein
MMTRKQTITSLALAGMAVLATVIITSISLATPVTAIGHFDNPDGLSDLSGLPTSDKSIDLKALLGKALKSESEGLPDSGDSSTASAVGGFPSDEMDAAGTPEQDSPTDGKEASPAGGDNSKGSLDSDNIGYEQLQECLSNIEGEGTPTEQQVQDCIGSSYGDRDRSENPPTDNAAEGDEDENSVTEHISDDEEEDEEDEGDTEDDFE